MVWSGLFIIIAMRAPPVPGLVLSMFICGLVLWYAGAPASGVWYCGWCWWDWYVF